MTGSDMKTTFFAMLLVTGFFLGCESDTVPVDTIPPFEPRGISTETGDGFVRVSWLANQEPDVVGYRIYVNDTYDGTYTVVGESSGLVFIDYGASNGVTTYYALTAVDASGNESGLSRDVAYDTPRPEGTGVALPNYLLDPARAGYDFSTYTIGPYNDEFTDFYYEFSDGTAYLDVWSDTEIQDVGYTTSITEIPYAPLAGWSPTGDVRLILGHTYVVRTWDNHFAKVRIRSMTDSHVTFDWAYQLQMGNPRLKQPATRAPLQPSAGFSSRMAAR
jgi:hypothetical protein